MNEHTSLLHVPCCPFDVAIGVGVELVADAIGDMEMEGGRETWREGGRESGREGKWEGGGREGGREHENYKRLLWT